ncbi:hypothetical protein PC9H_009560 [Pleurotus ostreatus]|uniref:IucC family-domain-containing protein n=2 Tax=Pleurotus TaxID=5320 RepID=A0A8H7DN23_PLEOS|nr:uncharacterized protein PC9H_009560 [Pleurotus ostreatus]KAF7424254.1 hypothetical protein PC9H_009560 [Pleurotus ostreatus]KAG9224708.1 hypothetical protein CCMSSC00406_0002141 [Pleurotus cornucopiae]KAJ8692869.1 hypothetical protein PTI98_010139 [Pleurotus ostreatus]
MTGATATMVVKATPADRALFATTARLISCLVTESVVRALYYTLDGFEASGVAVVLCNAMSTIDVNYGSNDILCVIPLQHVPVFKHDGADPRAPEIGLLDPLDMLPLVFEPIEATEASNAAEHTDLCAAIIKALPSPGWALPKSFKLVEFKGPLSIWHRYAANARIATDLSESIAEEFESAVKWQTYSYEHPPAAALFSSPSIDWEQSIVEGHPTHPMHKTRRFLPPITDFQPGEYDLYHPKLRFVALPKDDLKITHDFEGLTAPVREAASANANKPLVVPEGFLAIPVHELQVAHIQDKFKDAVIYPPEFYVSALAQQSIRSVIVPEAYKELSLKLGVGIKLTSAVRTISPASAYLGPRFSEQVVPALTMDWNIVTVAKELASVVHAHPDGEIAKHCSAIVRQCYENTSEERNERLIVCTSLVESGHAGSDGDVPAVIRIFDLDTEDKRADWLDKFVKLFFEAFLPSVIHDGVAFECHPQNCVARFDLDTKELRGFIIRDFGGLRIHPETLKASTGVDVDFVEGHSIIAEDLDDVYTRMYHTVIHNHLQQLIRVLGLHYNGRGWRIVRKHLHAIIPHDHGLYVSWLSPENKTFPGKCFMRMRMQGMYRFHLHGPFPNLIHYRGVSMEDDPIDA